MTEKSTAERIKELRRARGMTLEEVGKIVGVTKSTVRKWETGDIANMRRDKIATLAQALGTTPENLMGWKEKSSAKSDILPNYGIFPISYKSFRVLGEIACGKPIYADEDRETVILADSKIDADFCLYAKGDSMIGARIMDGDIVFIKNQPTVDNGEIAAVIIDDEATLKRVYYYPDKNKLVLNPENPKYEPLVYIGDELNTIRILGKAVAFQSAVR